MDFVRVRFCLANLNKLSNKLAPLGVLLHELGVDILAVTETWLVPSVSDAAVRISGYHPIARSDSPGSIPKHGVCFYVSTKLSFVTIECDVPNLHIILLNEFNCYCMVVYRPPSSNEHSNERLLTFLASFCVGKEIIILGDFNLPGLKWSDSPFGRPTDPLSRNLFDCFLALGLTQWVKFPTFLTSRNTLDLILTSDHDRVGEVRGIAPLPGCRHIPVVCDYTFFFAASSSVPESRDLGGLVKRAWNRGKYNQLNSFLQDVDWDIELSSPDVNICLNRFLGILNPLISRFVPLESSSPRRTSRRPPPRLAKRRKDAWRIYRLARSIYGRNSLDASTALQFYTSVNREYRLFFVNSQIEFESSLITSLKTNPKAFYSYLRARRVGAPTVGPLKSASSNELISDNGRMAELFVSSFASVFRDARLTPFPNQSNSTEISQLDLSMEDVVRCLKQVNASSSMGPDGVHPRLLTSCPAIAVPLFKIFSLSLSSGTVPDDWKKSSVVPLFKKGPRFDPLNYWPISLTSVARLWRESSSYILPSSWKTTPSCAMSSSGSAAADPWKNS